MASFSTPIERWETDDGRKLQLDDDITTDTFINRRCSSGEPIVVSVCGKAALIPFDIILEEAARYIRDKRRHAIGGMTDAEILGLANKAGDE